MAKTTITFIGSGRVAGALAESLYRVGYPIAAVISRNVETAQELASRVGAVATESYEIPRETGLLIIAVPDDAIAEVAEKVRAAKETVIVHTSGSTDIKIFDLLPQPCGVIYPLQTFTSGRSINMGEIHFFTESADSATLDFIDEIVGALSSNVHHLDSEKRSVLHLSAVFVSNFVNHMLYAGMSTAGREGIDRSVFTPLVMETVMKALDIGPGEAQTGPAVRNDKRTIAKHIELLSFSDDLMNLY
ncbi:MAG: DUF2520 domain-containing protein, partial [Bacteroidales bacterium]|nr:DUF2520 domain-containing protein [Bacteroidales bacterium]